MVRSVLFSRSGPLRVPTRNAVSVLRSRRHRRNPWVGPLGSAVLALAIVIFDASPGVGASARTAEDRPAASTGPGRGLPVVPTGDGARGGALIMNADGSYEDAYAWQFGGVTAPYYGAFAECFSIFSEDVCGLVLDVTRIGPAPERSLDAYVWSGDGAQPGTVLCVAPGQSPGQIAEWPAVSRHEFGVGCSVNTTPVYVGFWGRWPGEEAGWFIGADLDGFGGCPMTNIGPGLGYPTGWNSTSVVWQPTQALGIGMRVDERCGGACCLPDGSCEIVTIGAECDGEFIADAACYPLPCGPGACCLDDGSCSFTTYGICRDHGFFRGAGVPCDPNPCDRGACCYPWGCNETSRFSCEENGGGTFMGDDVPCDPYPCDPVPVGKASWGAIKNLYRERP